MFLSIADTKIAFAILQDPAFNPKPLYDKGLREQEASKPARLPGVHASEVASCVRKVRFTLNGASKVGPPSLKNVDLKKRFALGHAIHDMVQSALKVGAKTGNISFEEEVELADTSLGKELNLRSKADGVFTFHNDEGAPIARIGLEIKTEDHDAWKKITEPKEEHLDQATVYMAALDLPLMYFAYVSKSSGEWTPFKVPFTYVFEHGRWDKLRQRILQANAETNPYSLPGAAKSGTCMACSYRHLCRDSGSPATPTQWEWKK